MQKKTQQNNVHYSTAVYNFASFSKHKGTTIVSLFFGGSVFQEQNLIYISAESLATVQRTHCFTQPRVSPLLCLWRNLTLLHCCTLIAGGDTRETSSQRLLTHHNHCAQVAIGLKLLSAHRLYQLIGRRGHATSDPSARPKTRRGSKRTMRGIPPFLAVHFLQRVFCLDVGEGLSSVHCKMGLRRHRRSSLARWGGNSFKTVRFRISTRDSRVPR
jgi:hypothetical protein